MVSFIIHFQSTAGTQYQVRIYDDSYSGAPRSLIPASNVVSINEQDDNDMFYPVRTLSGYLKFLIPDGASYIIDDILPTNDHSRKIDIVRTSDNHIEFVGYLQPQTFSNELYELHQIYNIPISGFINTLDGKYIEYPNRASDNIAYVLQYIFLKTGIEPDYYYIQGSVNTTSWLNTKILWENLFNEHEDLTNNPFIYSKTMSGKYTYMELLEHICQFFGWTCRQFGKDIYLCSADDPSLPQWQQISNTRMSVIAGGAPVSADNILEWNDLTMQFVDIFRKNENKDIISSGYNEFTIDANINAPDNVLSIPIDWIRLIYEWSFGATHVSYPNNWHYFYIHHFDGAASGFNKGGVNITMPEGGSSYGAAVDLSQWFQQSSYMLHNYDMTQSFFLQGATKPSDKDHMMRIHIDKYLTLQDCMFVINGKLYQEYFDYTKNDLVKKSLSGNLVCRLKIGNRYWNGSAWVTSKSEFNMYFQDTINDTRVLDGDFESYTGYGALISSDNGGVQSGDITFEIVTAAVYSEGGGGISNLGTHLTDISFTIARKKQKALDSSISVYDDKNVYHKTSSNSFSENYSLDLIFYTDNNNKYGYGILLNQSGSLLSTLTYQDGQGTIQERPEEHLLDRLCNYYCKPVRIRSFKTRNSLMDTNPMTRIQSEDNEMYYPIMINKNYANDDITIKMAKI